MRRILVAIDYNPTSQTVAEAANQLALLTGAEICLLHIMADVSHYQMRYPTFMGYEGYDAGAVDMNVANEMRNVTIEFVQSVARHLNNDNISTQVEEGDAAESILIFAEKWNADLIVMGTHSHSILEKLLMGDVAATVLEKTKVPVYMVPVKQKD